MNTQTTILIAALLATGACGKGQPEGAAAGDSMIPPPDTALAQEVIQPMGDTALAMPKPETVFVSRPLPPKPRPVVRPSPAAAPAPAPAPAASTPTPEPAPAPVPAPAIVLAGRSISTSAMDSVHSEYSKVGDPVRVRVDVDVAGDDGRVVIPAGSVITLAIVNIAQAANRGEKGTLVLSARRVEIGGNSYPITARATDYAYEMKARGIGAGEVAKTGAGAVAGGLIGSVLGGKTATVIGAVGGAAAGGAIAARSANRDIIVHAGSSVTLTLRDDFSR